MSDGTWVVVNPASGGGTDPTEIAKLLRERLDPRIETTSRAGDARRLARRAADAGAGLVVAAGGDGTIREVVQGLLDGEGEAGESPVLGVLPLGTGNDLARSLAVPTDVGEALDLLVAGSVERTLDVMRVDLDGVGGWAVNAVVVGEGGRIGQVLDTDSKALWGPLSYLRSAAEVVVDLQAMAVRLSVDGEVRERTVLNVVVANGATAAGGVPIAPGASPFDGSLDVAVVAECGMAEAVRIGAALLGGADPESDAFHRDAGREVLVESTVALPVSVDGEVAEARCIRVDLAPSRLRVLAGR